jgi:nucleotide-binding universal stress UspA family protein
MSVAESHYMTLQTVHVVAGYDFSRSGHVALTRAVALAARSHGHVLHVVCAIEEGEPLPSIPTHDGVDYLYAAKVQDALAVAVQEELGSQGVVGSIEFFVHARIGKPAAVLMGVAREVGADLIVIGHHDITGLERLLVGSSIGARLIREAGCSVEIARPKQYADVELFPVVDPDATLPPHRYRYEDRRVVLA